VKYAGNTEADRQNQTRLFRYRVRSPPQFTRWRCRHSVAAATNFFVSVRFIQVRYL